MNVLALSVQYYSFIAIVHSYNTAELEQLHKHYYSITTLP